MSVTKSDINPATGKVYAINPATGVWDDNYWAQQVDPVVNAAEKAANALRASQPAPPPPIDLPALYKGLYESSGIVDIQGQYDNVGKQIYERQTARDKALGIVNDNPFYSEGTRVGRQAKVNDAYNNDATTLTGQQTTLQNQIAMKKADIETQLNLQTKQYDINSQAAQTAFNQFVSLLNAGAFDNASGSDIANATYATGVSSSMIQSAVDARKAANAKETPTSLISYDDGTNQGFALINTQTGEVINKQSVSASKATTTSSGGSGGSKASAKDQNIANLTQSVKNKVTLGTLLNAYRGILSVKEIYDIYNRYSPWGKAKESLSDLQKRYG